MHGRAWREATWKAEVGEQAHVPLQLWVQGGKLRWARARHAPSSLSEPAITGEISTQRLLVRGAQLL